FDTYPAHLSVEEAKAQVNRGELMRGKIAFDRYSCYSARVSYQDKSYLIKGLFNANRAIDGDTVAFRVIPGTGSSPSMDEDDSLGGVEGVGKGDADESAAAKGVDKEPERERDQEAQVVSILERTPRHFCGSVAIKFSTDDATGDITPEVDVSAARKSAHFRAVKKNLPSVRLVLSSVTEYIGKRIVVSIESWERDSKYPRGRVVDVLGLIGDRDVEAEVILREHQIRHFGLTNPLLLSELPEMPWNPDYVETQNGRRRDLREEQICSVDPPGCKDIDDALHFKYLLDKNGRRTGLCEIGVHIADVSHFVRAGTQIDSEARRRGTTVYLFDRRVDMLPKLLTEELCSLRGQVERYAFSCLFTIETETGDIKDTQFCKSLIKSKASFMYQEAQDIIDNTARYGVTTQTAPCLNDLNHPSVDVTPALAQGLRGLLMIAMKLRQVSLKSLVAHAAKKETKKERPPAIETRRTPSTTSSGHHDIPFSSPSLIRSGLSLPAIDASGHRTLPWERVILERALDVVSPVPLQGEFGETTKASLSQATSTLNLSYSSLPPATSPRAREPTLTESDMAQSAVPEEDILRTPHPNKTAPTPVPQPIVPQGEAEAEAEAEGSARRERQRDLSPIFTQTQGDLSFTDLGSVSHPAHPRTAKAKTPKSKGVYIPKDSLAARVPSLGLSKASVLPDLVIEKPATQYKSKDAVI
ncbi:LOW QUALITY PROTEIN: hypothetical protein KIPB_006998, partial [Kipferlia bialata]